VWRGVAYFRAETWMMGRDPCVPLVASVTTWAFLCAAGVFACTSTRSDIDAPTAIPDAGGADSGVCHADCECAPTALGQCCEQGRCLSPPEVCGRPMLGFCGPGGDCVCAGGTCDSRHCCVLPDGGVDNGLGLACRPVDL
jgi:hypothetical protein